MAARTLRLRGDHKELFQLFKTMLGEVNFFIIYEERKGDGFRVISVNRKRTSQLVSTLLSLIGGFIPRKRLVIELLAFERDGELTAELKCKPYLDNLDMEAVVESRAELDRCEQLVGLFGNRILEVMGLNDQRP